MEIKVLHLGIGRGNAGIQAGAELGVRGLEHPGPGDQRAEEQVTGRGIPREGEIHIDRAVRIQAGLLLIQNKTIPGLRAEIVDSVEDVFRVQPVDRLLRVYNPHFGKSFPADQKPPGTGEIHYNGFPDGCQKTCHGGKILLK